MLHILVPPVANPLRTWTAAPLDPELTRPPISARFGHGYMLRAFCAVVFIVALANFALAQTSARRQRSRLTSASPPLIVSLVLSLCGFENQNHALRENPAAART